MIKALTPHRAPSPTPGTSLMRCPDDNSIFQAEVRVRRSEARAAAAGGHQAARGIRQQLHLSVAQGTVHSTVHYSTVQYSGGAEGNFALNHGVIQRDL